VSEVDDYAPQSAYSTGMSGRCPRCGQGKLFKGFITLAPRCSVCGLDFGFAEAGDGPAVFVILLAGFLVVGVALWTELTFEPPFWVHIVIFLPLTLLVCLGLLRPLKGTLIALQYRNKAEQGRLDAKEP
jgi:uncharacterized protein (DUF983 family)